jgi:hypothetical protein
MLTLILRDRQENVEVKYSFLVVRIRGDPKISFPEAFRGLPQSILANDGKYIK